MSIQPQTILKVADNSGAKTVKCIKILDRLSKKSKYAQVGDCILVSVRSVRSGQGAPSASKRSTARSSTARSVIKGQIYKALVIRTKKGISNRIYGHSLAFPSNDVVLLAPGDHQGCIGSRIFGPITKELRALGLGFAKKIVSIGERIL
jgi:large subunit ribosomal protein L14